MRSPRMQVDGEPKYEIVRDPAVIAAYIRKRQLIDEETTLADTLAPTGDAEKDARAKKRSVPFSRAAAALSPPPPLGAARRSTDGGSRGRARTVR